jgi:ribosome maturation factor RimP
MKKKFFALAVALVIVAVAATFALSKGKTYSGKVTEVSRDKVTIELEEGKGSEFSVGDSVEVEVREKEAGKEGEFLMGC